MIKIFYVKNGDFSEVNTFLEKSNGKITHIAMAGQPVAISVSTNLYAKEECKGDVFTTVVVECPCTFKGE